jgi:hypothetical protein
MTWQTSSERAMWYAFYDLPTGWTALIADDSQVIAPRQETNYRIASSSRLLHIGWLETFETLEDAKREALLKTMQLPHAPETEDQALVQFRKYSPMAEEVKRG